MATTSLEVVIPEEEVVSGDTAGGQSMFDGGERTAAPTDFTDAVSEDTKTALADSPISTDAVSEQSDFEIVSEEPSPSLDGELGGFDQQQKENQLLKDTEDTTDEAAKAESSSFKDLIGGLMETPTQSELESSAFGIEGGVDDIKKELDNINQELRVEQHNLRRQIESIQDNIGGGFQGGQAIAIENAKRKSFRTQADLSVIQMGIQGRYDTALTIANRAVDAQVEKDQRRVDALGLQYQRNKSLFDKSEQREFELRLQDRQNEIESKKELETRRYALMIDAMKNGAPTSVLKAMSSSGDIAGAMEASGGYIGKYERIQAQQSMANASLDRRIKLMELAMTGDPQAIEELGAFGGQITSGASLQNDLDYTKAQRDIDRWTTSLVDSELGLQLSAGAGQSPVLSSILTSAGFNYFKYRDAKEDYLVSATELVNTFGFKELIDLKKGGATFGALSEGEFNAIKSASSALASAAIMEDGVVIGFRGSEEKVRSAVQEIMTELVEVQAERTRSMVSNTDQKEVINLP